MKGRAGCALVFDAANASDPANLRPERERQLIYVSGNFRFSCCLDTVELQKLWNNVNHPLDKGVKSRGFCGKAGYILAFGEEHAGIKVKRHIDIENDFNHFPIIAECPPLKKALSGAAMDDGPEQRCESDPYNESGQIDHDRLNLFHQFLTVF